MSRLIYIWVLKKNGESHWHPLHATFAVSKNSKLKLLMYPHGKTVSKFPKDYPNQCYLRSAKSGSPDLSLRFPLDSPLTYVFLHKNVCKHCKLLSHEDYRRVCSCNWLYSIQSCFFHIMVLLWTIYGKWESVTLSLRQW